ncbi:zinc-binding dehydrogenase [Actinomadura sp. 3N407]|uniref:zinc-binding dehydrogenase n=1 Tax=Actinomadura sp. 3N407 TaxID=3457423 RepID=UPI003FCE1B11
MDHHVQHRRGHLGRHRPTPWRRPHPAPRTHPGLTAGGRLRPAIGAVYPLARAADAHRALAARTTVGKSLLSV